MDKGTKVLDMRRWRKRTFSFVSFILNLVCQMFSLGFGSLSVSVRPKREISSIIVQRYPRFEIVRLSFVE